MFKMNHKKYLVIIFAVVFVYISIFLVLKMSQYNAFYSPEWEDEAKNNQMGDQQTGYLEMMLKYYPNTMHKEDADKPNYLHRGIATRSFKRLVQIADDVVVKDAVMKDGLLSIDLEQIVPEEKQAKTIKIK